METTPSSSSKTEAETEPGDVKESEDATTVDASPPPPEGEDTAAVPPPPPPPGDGNAATTGKPGEAVGMEAGADAENSAVARSEHEYYYGIGCRALALSVAFSFVANGGIDAMLSAFGCGLSFFLVHLVAERRPMIPDNALFLHDVFFLVENLPFRFVHSTSATLFPGLLWPVFRGRKSRLCGDNGKLVFY